ncbi:MAG: DUF4234 domain-containing protein [Clostridiales bacterium]|nr:DUF4234 domain-containing protein [Clostridiales bacterium]
MQSKKRDGLISSVLGLITCGIYSIYFWYKYGEDVNEICAEDGKETPNYIVAWLLSIITCGIYGMYWLYNLGSRLDTASKKYDVNVESPVFFTLFMNIPFLSYFYACDLMNKFQEQHQKMYPNGTPGYRNPGSGYAAGGFGGNVPPVTPRSGGNAQSMGAQIGSQLKSAVQDMGNGIKNTAQSAMPTCKNCGAVVPPGKNYCKKCGYPVNAPGAQNGYTNEMPRQPEMKMQPEMPKAPEMKMQPEMPKAPEMKMQPEMPKAPEMKVQPEMPKAPEMKMQPEMPKAPEMKVQPEMPKAPEMKMQPEMPKAPEMKMQPEMPKAPQMPVCPKCGNPVKPGDRFCINCGSKINE